MTGGTEGDYLFGGLGLDQMLGEDGDDLLSGQGGNDRVDGGAGNDQMHGDDGDDIMIGGTGNDDINGGAGNDLFVFAGSFGQDRIYGFAPGTGSEDRILLTGLGFASFADVLAHTTLGGSGAVINVSGDTITLIGVSVASLAADDFLI